MLDRRQGLFHRVGDARAGAFQTNILHGLVKAVPVLCLVDCINTGADQFDVILFQDAVGGQFQGRVKRSLTTHGRQDRVGTLFFNDLFQGLPIDRLDVGGIGHGRIGHDRGGVRVHQDDSIALFAQCFAGLRAGIIKFACLADDDGARANDQDTVEIRSSRHYAASMSAINWSNKAMMSCGPGLASGCP